MNFKIYRQGRQKEFLCYHILKQNGSKDGLTSINVPSFLSFVLLPSPQLTASMIPFKGDSVVIKYALRLLARFNHVVITCWPHTNFRLEYKRAVFLVPVSKFNLFSNLSASKTASLFTVILAVCNEINSGQVNFGLTKHMPFLIRFLRERNMLTGNVINKGVLQIITLTFEN